MSTTTVLMLVFPGLLAYFVFAVVVGKCLAFGTEDLELYDQERG